MSVAAGDIPEATIHIETISTIVLRPLLPFISIPNDIKVIVKVRTGSTSPISLNMIADGDLASGSDTIPVQNVIWQASGQGFVSGTLSKSTLQTAGFWKGSGVREGVFRYYLNNSWNYQKREYQVTVTYTLTTP